MTNEQAQRVYFNKHGRPTLFQPHDLEAWVAERAAQNVCMRLGRNTVDANDIHASFDVQRACWGHTPAEAAAWLAEQYWNDRIASREG